MAEDSYKNYVLGVRHTCINFAYSIVFVPGGKIGLVINHAEKSLLMSLFSTFLLPL